MITNTHKTISVILELGRRLVQTGAEVWLVEDRLRVIFDAYGFKSCDLKVMTSDIEATVCTQEDKMYTQIKEVPPKKYDMDKLEKLSALSERMLRDTPGPDEVEREFGRIENGPEYKKVILFLAGAFGAANFTMFFNGYRQDVAIVGICAILIAFLKDRIGRQERNPLIYNTLLAYLMEVLAIMAMIAGAGRSLTSMTAGIIMLLISGFGITNGMSDLLHENILSGVTDFMESLLGAMGISIGISLALLTFGEKVLEHIQGQEVVQSQTVQMIACIGGCIGFAIVANCRGWIILYSGIGALITRVTYLISLKLADGNYFTATLMAACGAAFFANLLSLIINTPPSIFLTTFILPVIPSSTLYLTVYAIIMDDRLSYHENGRRLFLVCVAIALGFIIVEVMFKYGIMILRKLKQDS